MTARQKLHQAHLTEWAARISDQKNSGLTIRQWCDQKHVSFHKYNYWKHLLKEEFVDQMLPDIVPLSVPVSMAPAAAAVPQDEVSDQIVPDRNDPTNRTNRAFFSNPNVCLCIDGVSIEIDPSVPEDFLRTLVKAVHYA